MLNFQELIIRAKRGENSAIEEMLEMYRPLLTKESIVEGVKLGEFLSKDDFKTRCKVSSTVTDTMARLGILGDLPETNQISLMDMFGI